MNTSLIKIMNKKAFTLVEMIIVVVLIGLVSTLAVGGFQNIQKDARKRTIAARAQQLNIAKQQYISEFGRLSAETVWASPAGQISLISGQTSSGCALDSERRYNLLKRYIERPQAYLSDCMPEGTTLSTPNTVHGRYRAFLILDSGNRSAITLPSY